MDEPFKNLISITVQGTPRARPRPRHGVRFSKQRNAHVSVTYQPTKLVISRKTGKPTPDSLAWVRANEWYAAVRLAVQRYLPAEPWSGPVRVCINVYFERTKELQKKKYPAGAIRHTGKPDRDNVDKSILDALTEAGLWLDDGQVCSGGVEKWYAAKGYGPGVVIECELISQYEEDIVLPTKEAVC